MRLGCRNNRDYRTTMTTSDTQILFSVVPGKMSPVGAVVVSEGSFAEINPWKFSTRYFDSETGIGKWPRRDYVSEINRWKSRDHAGERAGLHRYAFIRNAVVSRWDALGLQDSGIEITDPFGPPTTGGGTWPDMPGTDPKSMCCLSSWQNTCSKYRDDILGAACQLKAGWGAADSPADSGGICCKCTCCTYRQLQKGRFKISAASENMYEVDGFNMRDWVEETPFPTSADTCQGHAVDYPGFHDYRDVVTQMTHGVLDEGVYKLYKSDIEFGLYDSCQGTWVVGPLRMMVDIAGMTPGNRVHSCDGDTYSLTINWTGSN